MLFPFVSRICSRSEKHWFFFAGDLATDMFYLAPQHRGSTLRKHLEICMIPPCSGKCCNTFGGETVGELTSVMLGQKLKDSSRDQPGKVRQRSIKVLIREGNTWKGGINEHPFLQKIKTVESKMNKKRIRKVGGGGSNSLCWESNEEG